MISISQEPDHIPRRPLAVSAIAIAVSILASIVVAVLLAGRHLRLARETPAAGPPARVESSVFQVQTDAERANHTASEQLRSWGWSDKSRGTIHVPLDVAIELYLEEPK